MHPSWKLMFSLIVIPILSFAAGDVDNSGTVDLSDTIRTLQVNAGNNQSLDTIEDVNKDGKIGLQEAIYTLQHVSGITAPETIIIADHTAVERYVDIPQRYIDEIKKMYICVLGMSHSEAYRRGLEILEEQDSRFAVNVTEGPNGTVPEEYTEAHLRISRMWRNKYGWFVPSAGEETYWTSQTAIDEMHQHHIEYCRQNNLRITAMGFAWCWDMAFNYSDPGSENPAGDIQSFGGRWSGGLNVYGNDPVHPWGNTPADSSPCMQDYLDAVEQYMAQDPTIVHFFTTGPVDGYLGENGWQRHQKHEYIRDYVKSRPGSVLFDFADILTYDNDNTQNIVNWEGHFWPHITDTNLGDGMVGHIGEAGALRLGKALWWMLARISGWNGQAE